ncbi:MAG: LamG domain-containing protein, partial [Anaerohalosphaera sp.]|nr:LamG domain-containing protein [Anaerohalosphaera sp.]
GAWDNNALAATDAVALMGDYINIRAVSGQQNSVDVTIGGLAAGSAYTLVLYGGGDVADQLAHFTVDAVMKSTLGGAAVPLASPQHYVTFTGNADMNGDILVIWTQPEGTWSALNGFQLRVEPKQSAWNPSPDNGAEGIVPEGITLGWNTAMDPDNLSQVNPNVTLHKLYISGPDSIANPDLYWVEDIAAGAPDPTAQSSPQTLSRDGTYLWRVDEVVGPNPATDPNDVIVGTVWSFKTVLSLPEIVTQPRHIWADEGETVNYTVEAANPIAGDLTYAWYQGVSPDTSNPVGDNSPTLEVTVTAADLNTSFYCRVNNVNGDTDTDAAGLNEKILLAHWPMDNAVDPNSITEGAPGTVAYGDPEVVEGVVGQAMEFDGNDGLNTSIADTGAYFEDMNQYCTVSCWVKSASSPDWNPLVCKRGESDEGWQIRKRGGSGDKVCFTTRGTSNDDAPVSTTGVFDDQWHLVVGVFDGQTKKIYVDGLFNAEVSVSGPIAATVSPVSIGCRIWQSGEDWYIGNFFTGSLDDIKLYSYPMTSQQVADLYVAVKSELCLESIAADLNNDCEVDLEDFAIIAGQWLDCNRYPDCVDTIE